MTNTANTRKAGFLRGFFSIFLGNSLHIILTLLSGIVLARSLGPAGKGILSGILVYPILFQSLFEGGLRQSAIYFVGQNKRPMDEILGSMMIGYVATSFLGCVGSYCSIYFFVHTKLSWFLMVAISLLVPAHIGVSYIKGILLGRGKIKTFSRATWFPALFLLTSLMIMQVSAGLTVDRAILATVFAAYLGFFQAIWYLFNNVPLRVRINGAVLWQMFRLGIVYALALFSITLNYRIDIALLSYWSTANEVGIYTVATNFGELIWYLPGVLVPLIFSRSATSQGTDYFQKLVKIVKFGSPAICCIAILFGSVAVYLIPFFYGSQFNASAHGLLLLLPGLTAMILFKILNADMAGQGVPILALYAMVPGVIINVVLNFFLIPPYGASGAAFSSTVSYILSALLFLLGYVKKRGTSLKSLFAYETEDLFWIKNKIYLFFAKLKG